ncbi:MAG TPA: hypothetical protein V6D06_18300, partial [Trichocoleus sp.]
MRTQLALISALAAVGLAWSLPASAAQGDHLVPLPADTLADSLALPSETPLLAQLSSAQQDQLDELLRQAEDKVNARD